MERSARRECRRYWLLFFGMLLLILITRLLTVRHSMALHPDEWVFYTSASSVVTPPDYAFHAAKYYPNGAFVFQMPFQFLRYALSLSGMVDISPQLMGRLASIFYFLCGCALGFRLVWWHSGGRLPAVLVYALIMVFSPFQIEQSRYGTGDPISLLVVMGMLTVLDLYLRENADFYLYFAGFLAGVLAAIKFPLYVFIALPIGQRCLVKRDKAKTQDICLCLLFSAVGLAVFSPTFYSDPTFFMQALFKEFKAYVGPGAYTPWDHFLSVNAFQFLYADLLLGPVLGVLGIFALRRTEGKQSIYRWMMPCLLWIFFLVNAFTKRLFFRTYYPFFCIQAIYIAIGLDWFAGKSRAKRWISVALVALVVVRGGMFVQMLATTPSYAQTTAMLAAVPGWNDRIGTVVVGGNKFSRVSLKSVPEKTYVYEYSGVEAELPGKFPIFPGEFVISAHRGIVRPASGDGDSLVYIGDTGSDFVRYLYGTELEGSSLLHLEIPMYYLYYCQDDRDAPPLTPEKRQQYTDLYLTWEPGAYFAQLGKMEDITVMVVSQGAIEPSLRQALPFAASEIPQEDAFVLVAEQIGGGYEVRHAGDRMAMEEAYTPDDGSGNVFALRSSMDATASIDFFDREYTSGRTGLTLAVYDRGAQAVLDWVLLFEEGGATVMERY